MSEQLVSASSLTTLLFFDFLHLVLLFIIVILGLRIILRVEKKLDLFFKFLVLGFFVALLYQFLGIFVKLEILAFIDWFNLLDLLPEFLVIIALVIMNTLISQLENK
jgi:hypothetical protein